MTTWTKPEFVEIDMSAEIGSYQDDFEPREDWTDRVSVESTEQADSAS
jgi:coenzyme PQQ precursor peptide PqqA